MSNVPASFQKFHSKNMRLYVCEMMIYMIAQYPHDYVWKFDFTNKF